MMKRRRLLITGVLLLLGGAIVNVAVAWNAAYTLGNADQMRRFNWTSLPTRSLRINEQSWYLANREKIKAVSPFPLNQLSEMQIAESRRFAIRTTHFVENRTANGVRFPTAVQVQAGWPLESLGVTFWTTSIREPPSVEPTHTGWVVPDIGSTNGPSERRVLPIAPIWPGFAINTIFYAAMLWVVFFVPGMVRRTIRRRRGFCPACAYPIGTSPVCTECGKAVE